MRLRRSFPSGGRAARSIDRDGSIAVRMTLVIVATKA
jgi:hypothetical protein